MEEKEIKCSGCHEIFVLRSAERELCSHRRIPEPRYCPICRKAYREKKEQERQRQADLEWKVKKEEDFRQYTEKLKEWNVVSLEELEADVGDETLYVIGNGFDLMHGAKSSYYDFNKTLGKHSQIRFYLETYLKADDLWADFEGALAKINVEAMCSPVTIDMFLDTMGAYDEDAGMAEIYGAAEMAAGPIMSMNTDLKKRFRAWIEKLSVNTDDRPLGNVIKQGKVLNFNYTEFVEALYRVDESDICYIHGCRKRKKGMPREELILGHMPGESDPEYEFEDRYSGIRLSGNRAQMIYDTQQISLGFVQEADEGLTKNCDEIIKNHKSFFEGLTAINKVITIGHSLYPVDWDYFEEVIRSSGSKDSIKWYFGCHGKSDLERISAFISHFGIKESCVSIFRTDLITVTLNSTDDCSNNQKLKQEKARPLCISDDGKWEVTSYKNRVTIIDRQWNQQMLSRIFSIDMNGAVFDQSGTLLLMVARGIYEGVFLLRLVNGKWHYVRELEGIPNQGVITKRLHKILLEDDQIIFVYNSRIRKYDAKNGKLIFNQPSRRTFERKYEGEDVTDKLRKIYKTGFY